jgi:hypothetical protein
MATFALATPVRWGDSALFELSFYAELEWVRWLTQTFRASGRFIWPVAYLLNLAACMVVVCGLSTRRVLASAILVGALGLQLADVDIARTQGLFAARRDGVRAAVEWSLADGDFDHLVLYPAEIQGACDGPQRYRGEVVSELAYLAYRHGWTFNSGYAARLKPGTRASCDALKASIETGKLDPRAIYVVWRWNVRQMWRAGATCGRIDRTTVCVLPQERAFARYLAAHPP